MMLHHKIVNDTQDYIELDKINIFENYFRSIQNIRFKNVKHCRFFLSNEYDEKTSSIDINIERKSHRRSNIQRSQQRLSCNVSKS